MEKYKYTYQDDHETRQGAAWEFSANPRHLSHLYIQPGFCGSAASLPVDQAITEFYKDAQHLKRMKEIFGKKFDTMGYEPTRLSFTVKIPHLSTRRWYWLTITTDNDTKRCEKCGFIKLQSYDDDGHYYCLNCHCKDYCK